jgi:hypothetical protein
MKSLKEILERKDDTMVTIEPWADYILVDTGKDSIEYLAFDEVKDADVKKLKLGESLVKDETKIYLCITDTSVIEEK